MTKKFLVGLVASMLTAGCAKEEESVNQTVARPMLGAVMYGETDKVRRLAEKGIGLDERRPANNSTPMIFAAATDQWPAVEILIDHGADIWAYDMFGVTAARFAPTSRVERGSTEDQARLRVIEKLKARGYPFPPPNSDEVMALVERGEWPSSGTKQ